MIYSHTQLNMFRRCPTQYWFRYIKGQKVMPAGIMRTGVAGHETLAENFNHKIKSKEDLPLLEFKGDFETRFDRMVKEEELDWRNDNPGELKTAFLGARGGSVSKSRTGLLDVVHKEHLPPIEPIKVEHHFQIEIDGEKGREPIKVQGYIDVVAKIGKKVSVRDAKFKGRADRQSAHTSDQLTLYGLAMEAEGVKLNGFAEDVLIHGSTPRVEPIETKRTGRDYERVIKEFGELDRQVKLLGDDPRNYPLTSPDNWWCGQKFCGYWSKCPRGGGNYK